MRVFPRARIQEALRVVDTPEWVHEVRTEPKLDQYDEPGIDIIVVVRAGERDVFMDGRQLNDVARRLRDALRSADIEMWPFVRFISADEIEAA